MLTDSDSDRLASMIRVIRPDWGHPRLAQLLQRPELRQRSFAELVVALAALLADPAVDGPGKLLSDGPWWSAARIAGRRNGRDNTFVECPEHPGEPAGRCAKCQLEAADPPPDWRPTRTDPREEPHDEAPRDVSSPFANTSPMPRGLTMRRCRCGGTFYIDTDDGIVAHETVFGHRPVVERETSTHGSEPSVETSGVH